MAKSDGASMPIGSERSLLSLLRESGDALEAASPPFNAVAAASRLWEAARARGLLRPGRIPEDNLAVTGAELEEEAPPFDVETGAARLREAARARGLLSSGASEDSAAQDDQVSEVPPLVEAELDQTILRSRAEHEVRTATNAQTSSPAAQEGMASSEARGQLGIGEVLAQLRPEFPDISVSKIRFLEAEGLIEPTRSGSGYRRFCAADIERLRHILIMQRDFYLPLQAIREQLAHLEGLRARADAGDQAAAGQLANLPEGLRARADHRLRGQPHLLALRVLAHSEAATGLPRRVVAEVIRETMAVLAEAEAAARAVENSVGVIPDNPQAGTFLRVRLNRLAAVAEDAITAAAVGDSAEMRRHLNRFETLTEAIWTAQDAVFGSARPHLATRRPATGADDLGGLRARADADDQAAAGWSG